MTRKEMLKKSNGRKKLKQVSSQFFVIFINELVNDDKRNHSVSIEMDTFTQHSIRRSWVYGQSRA